MIQSIENARAKGMTYGVDFASMVMSLSTFFSSFFCALGYHLLLTMIVLGKEDSSCSTSPAYILLVCYIESCRFQRKFKPLADK